MSHQHIATKWSKMAILLSFPKKYRLVYQFFVTFVCLNWLHEVWFKFNILFLKKLKL